MITLVGKATGFVDFLAHLQVKPILARLKTTLAGSTAALVMSAGLLVGLVQAGTDSDGSYGELTVLQSSNCCPVFKLMFAQPPPAVAVHTEGI